MNNLSEIRKQFAKTYGVPAGNCKNSRRLLFMKGFTPILIYFTASCILAGMMLTNALTACFPSFPKLFGILSYFLIILLACGAYLLNKLLKKSESDMDAYDIGIEGENAVATELTFLPPDYIVFHSVNIPDYKGDFDHIVLGPNGIIIIETKKWKTTIGFKDGKLDYDRANYPKDPIEQLKNQAISLKTYLEKSAGLERLWIQGVLCFVDQKLEGVPQGQIDTCYVTNEKKLYDRIERYNLHRISEKDMGLIEGKLSELCRK